jgi:hypothetical protein
MMLYFVFKGDKIDLYDTIFKLKDSFEEIKIDYLELVRNIDSIVTSNLWVMPKIKKLKDFIDEIENGVAYFNMQQLINFVKLTKILNTYYNHGFRSYFEFDCFGKITSFYVPKEGFSYHAPNLIIGTYVNF